MKRCLTLTLLTRKSYNLEVPSLYYFLYGYSMLEPQVFMTQIPNLDSETTRFQKPLSLFPLGGLLAQARLYYLLIRVFLLFFLYIYHHEFSQTARKHGFTTQIYEIQVWDRIHVKSKIDFRTVSTHISYIN